MWDEFDFDGSGGGGGGYEVGSDFDWGADYSGGWDSGWDDGGWDSGGGDWGGWDTWDFGDNGGDYGGNYGGGSYDWGNAGWSDSWNNWDSYNPDTSWWSGDGDANSYALQNGGGYQAGQGQFGQGQQGGYNTGSVEVTAPTAGNSGVTGAFGVGAQNDNGEFKGTPMLNGAYWNQRGYAADGSGPPVSAMNNGEGPSKGVFGDARQWARENSDLARLGIGIAGMLAARKDQKRADDLMQQTLADRERERQMKEEMWKAQMENMKAARGAQGRAQSSQSSAVRRNNQEADFWNNQARQSASEARSLYNPQELGIRGYATEAAATGRSVQDIRDRMARQGKSQGTIDAEVRRAKVAGSTNATTGYMKGLDTGRSSQMGALSASKGLASQYSALSPVSLPSLSLPGGMGSNADLANYYTGQAGDNSNAIQDLLNYYLGNPMGKSNEDQLK